MTFVRPKNPKWTKQGKVVSMSKIQADKLDIGKASRTSKKGNGSKIKWQTDKQERAISTDLSTKRNGTRIGKRHLIKFFL